LGFLIILFTFIGNNFDQASIAKRSKRGSKDENKAWRQLAISHALLFVFSCSILFPLK